MALSPAQKKKVKAAIAAKAVGDAVAGKGAYKRNFVRGKGDFFSDIIGTALAPVKALAAPLAAPLAIGGALAQRAGQFVGQGAYRNFVRGKGDFFAGKGMPMSGTLAPPSVPLMSKSSRSNTFTYREYLGDIYSSIDFSNTVFHLNPGLGDPGSPVDTMSGMFPWLAPTAAKYEQYRIDQAIIEFISTSSDAVVSGATTSSLGQVCIATQYNTNLASFTNLTDALNSQYATTEKPSINFCHPIECVPREKTQNVQYVRTAPLATGQDILQYDMGQVNLITQGMPADGEVIGQLWITYKVSLFKPILLSEQGANIRFAHYTYNNSHSDISSGNMWGTNADNMTAKAGSTMAFVFPGTNVVSFAGTQANDQAGMYQVTVMIKGASTVSCTSPTPTAAGGSTVATIWGGNTVPNISLPQASTTTNVFCSFIWKVTDSTTATLNFSGNTMPSTITSTEFFITQLPDAATLLGEEKEMKFRNFWRGTKRQPTAPWLRGKYIHDRTQAPKRYIEYTQTPRIEYHIKDSVRIEGPPGWVDEKKAEEKRLERAHEIFVKEFEGLEDDDEDDERLLKMLLRKRSQRQLTLARAEKASTQPEPEYVKVEEPQQTPKPPSTSKKA